VAIHAGARDDASWALCRRAVELDPKGPTAALFLAEMAQRRNEPSAGEALAHAREALEQMKDAPADHWSYLAALHRARQEVSAAEEAASHAGADQGAAEVRDWAQRTRRWVGLVPGAVPAGREGDYVREFRQAELELEQGQYGRASQRMDALEKEFTGAVGPFTLRCELQLRQGTWLRGMKECRRALDRYSDSVHAQYLLGVGASGSRSWKDAASSLERVVDLDPTIPDAWTRLSDAYRATGNTRSVDRLKERYRERFGKPAPFR
jgi:predicted Zn-dependent protease